MAEKRFYVYQFVQDGKVLYVGKGSGRRLHKQNKRFGFDGEIVKYFATDSAAYNFEIRLIAKLKPSLNMNCGGGGPNVRKRLPRKPYERSGGWRSDQELNESRIYVAKALLNKFGIERLVSPEILDQMKMVASGNLSQISA